jgi:hypothetical protein
MRSWTPFSAWKFQSTLKKTLHTKSSYGFIFFSSVIHKFWINEPIISVKMNCHDKYCNELKISCLFNKKFDKFFFCSHVFFFFSFMITLLEEYLLCIFIRVRRTKYWKYYIHEIKKKIIPVYWQLTHHKLAPTCWHTNIVNSYS